MPINLLYKIECCMNLFFAIFEIRFSLIFYESENYRIYFFLYLCTILKYYTLFIDSR